mmetsp:Transcript_96551/g.191371  ORF Transcript_96551/g.191371 Transcript_96551/m.191371 type:complete len:359 (-) Transcript_96551:120-1196(-)
MATETACSATLVASRHALASFQKQLAAANSVVIAVQDMRVALAGLHDLEAELETVEAAAQAARGAGDALISLHQQIVGAHCTEIGDDTNVRNAAPQQPAPNDLRQPSGEKAETMTSEVHHQPALPEDNGTCRVAPAVGAVEFAPSAAAAAFAAAEAASLRRQNPEGLLNSNAADATILHSCWRPDFEAYADDTRKQQALTKQIDGHHNFDFSMFNREGWLRAQRQAEDMLAEQESGVYCFRDSLPHPQSKVPGCAQVKVWHVQTNTEEKIKRCYHAMAAGGGADRVGFLLGASLGRFMTLARERSTDSVNGGDLGWVVRGKLDPRIEEVAFHCPRGACSPPFRVKLASFHLVFCEERR